MGMYTEFHCNAALKADTPPNVIKVLEFMTGQAGKMEPVGLEIPDHPLFQCSRWVFMLRCGSAYFDAPTLSIVEQSWWNWQNVLSIRCSFKNYEGEIEKFCDWIMPYLDKVPGDFLGFSRYEETQTPDLIYAKEVNHD